MEALVHWFSQNLSQYISPEGAVFIISMIPLLELRGGLLAASLLKISAAKAIPLCIVGNIIPIPFILLFIRQIFKVLKKTKLFRGLVMKLEDRAMRKSDQVKKYEFWGLMLFVGIPLPGTGAWTETGGEGTCDKTLRYGKTHPGAYHVFLLWEISAGCEEAGGLPGTAGHERELQ